MLDIRRLRETPETVKTLLAFRGPGYEAMIDEVLAVDSQRRTNETRWQHLQSERKNLSKQIGALRAKKEDSTALEEESKKLGAEMESIQAASAAAEEKQRDLLLSIPNTPHDEIPRGSDASANPVLRTYVFTRLLCLSCSATQRPVRACHEPRPLQGAFIFPPLRRRGRLSA